MLIYGPDPVPQFLFSPIILQSSIFYLDCYQLEVLEQIAFDYCPHGSDGFTWQAVVDCEVNFCLLTLLSSTNKMFISGKGW